MDNLGEAQDVNKGLWPADKPVGQHPSVLSTLPRMLDLLDQQQQQHGGGIKATYFAESWSLGVYPGAVRALGARGHEVAWHGYQHEAWRGLSAGEEALNFERSFAEARRHGGDGDGLAYEGFRPPGGELNGDRTYALLRRYGVGYVSPLGTFGIVSGGSGDGDGIVVLPFEWETVDAFWYMDKFSAVRAARGAPEEAPGPAAFRDYLLAKLDEVKRGGGYISILFHPFLQTSEDRFDVLREVLERIGGDDEIWCAPCGEVAGWVREHADQFGFQS
jgi:peptidoglycan/xylan/chitin deacetylase (PgdA/CDA1 family)